MTESDLLKHQIISSCLVFKNTISLTEGGKTDFKPSPLCSALTLSLFSTKEKIEKVLNLDETLKFLKALDRRHFKQANRVFLGITQRALYYDAKVHTVPNPPHWTYEEVESSLDSTGGEGEPGLMRAFINKYCPSVLQLKSDVPLSGLLMLVDLIMDTEYSTNEKANELVRGHLTKFAQNPLLLRYLFDKIPIIMFAPQGDKALDTIISHFIGKELW